jgi:microcystin-dependent protein
MSCQGCFNGCGTITPDTCVRYTGDSIPLLGINNGDPVSKVEEAIIDKVVEFAEGNGIALADIDLKCPFIEDLFGCCQDKTLKNLIQVLIDANCTLKELVDTLSATVNSVYSFNVVCLTGLPVNPTRDDILQALLNKVCEMDSTLTTIANDYVKASQLNSLIASYLSSVSGGTVQQSTKMVPYVAYEYYGPLSNFDSGGVGIASAGYQKVYICNGSNGTPDRRGRVAVGAVQGVPGGALDSAVDPTNPANPSTNYVLNQKWGSSYITLTTGQMPSHSHTVTDAGHSHTITGSNETSFTSGGAVAAVQMDGAEAAGSTNTATTGITIASAGSSQAHDNRQPSIGAYFIMYIP